jgi:hypothetical protein
MMTMEKFVKDRRIKIVDCEMVGENPYNPDWTNAYHYKVKLRNGSNRRVMTVHYSMGYAHSREPEAPEILDCLRSDYESTMWGTNFEDWAREFGYDSDSRKAERIYHACIESGRKLKQFIGDDVNTFLEDVERM